METLILGDRVILDKCSDKNYRGRIGNVIEIKDGSNGSLKLKVHWKEECIKTWVDIKTISKL